MTAMNEYVPNDEMLSTENLLLELVELGLYEDLTLAVNGNSQLKDLRLFGGRFDKYCPMCQKHTTWNTQVPDEVEHQATLDKMPVLRAASPGGKRSAHDWVEDFTLWMVCARDERHRGQLYFKVEGPSLYEELQHTSGTLKELQATVITKVGQWPSISDFQLGDLSEFEDGMTKYQRKDFVRATHSAAHGFNVGACVYYRRVFESVLAEARPDGVAGVQRHANR
jgi:hypothetical protein